MPHRQASIKIFKLKNLLQFKTLFKLTPVYTIWTITCFCKTTYSVDLCKAPPPRASEFHPWVCSPAPIYSFPRQWFPTFSYLLSSPMTSLGCTQSIPPTITPGGGGRLLIADEFPAVCRLKRSIWNRPPSQYSGFPSPHSIYKSPSANVSANIHLTSIISLTISAAFAPGSDFTDRLSCLWINVLRPSKRFQNRCILGKYIFSAHRKFFS